MIASGWFWSSDSPDMTNNGKEVGRWLGVSHQIGSLLSYWILTPSGKVVSRTTVQHITAGDMVLEGSKVKLNSLIALLQSNLTTPTSFMMMGQLSSWRMFQMTTPFCRLTQLQK